VLLPAQTIPQSPQLLLSVAVTVQNNEMPASGSPHRLPGG
jgi:hypothetical protein